MKAPHLALAVAAAAALLPGDGVAQRASNNVVLLGRFDPSGYTYNDIWGYTSPQGKEYAILGATTGTFIVDCTDPTNPVQRAFIRASRSGWRSSTWRDMRTYRNYIYVVTEGGGGMQIIDMAIPDQPVLVKTWGTSIWRDAHNVAIDTGAGVLYPCGTNVGVPIISLADPVNPTRIGSWTRRSVHDLHVQDGFAHLAEISSSRYEILDVSNLPSTPSLGTSSVSSCHNSWPTRDNDYAVLTSERSGGAVTIMDITNKRLPRRIATYRTGRSTTSVHNAYVRDRVCHMAYYSEGYRSLDLSDPPNPVEVAFYDTSSATSGYSGNWGCFPFQPSGVIYASDFQNGLFVFATPASTERYGQATAGVGARAPQIYSFGCAFSGNRNFKLEVEDAAPNADGLLAIGIAGGSMPAAGITLLVDMTQAAISLPIRTDAAGKASIPMAVAASIRSGDLFAQFVVTDSQAPGGYSASRGLRFTVFTLGDT